MIDDIANMVDALVDLLSHDALADHYGVKKLSREELQMSMFASALVESINSSGDMNPGTAFWGWLYKTYFGLLRDITGLSLETIKARALSYGHFKVPRIDHRQPPETLRDLFLLATEPEETNADNHATAQEGRKQ